MQIRTTFKRIEKKYVINQVQYETMMKYVDEYFHPDQYGQTTICNLYFDTFDYLLTRRSIERPDFKEKLRLRSYGVPKGDSTTFMEIKRKANGTVYKRRVSLPYSDAIAYYTRQRELGDAQIEKEIDYFFRFYQGIEPKFFISYDRSAYFKKGDDDFRITFDKNIFFRQNDLDLSKGAYGERLIPEDCYLMELKVADNLPLDLARLLSSLNLASTSFSKVGTAYKKLLSQRSLL